jgi:hypothetical protein
MAQQTAVEWLLNRVEDVDNTPEIWDKIKVQAKQMEKEHKQNGLKIIEAQNQYIEVLRKEIDSAASIAHVHGWKSNLVEEGENLRNEIDLLSKSFNNFI